MVFKSQTKRDTARMREAKVGKEKGGGMERAVVIRDDKKNSAHTRRQKQGEGRGAAAPISLPSPSAPDKVLVVQKWSPIPHPMQRPLLLEHSTHQCLKTKRVMEKAACWRMRET